MHRAALIPSSRRRAAAVVGAALALALLVAVAVPVAGTSEPTAPDRAVNRWLDGWLPHNVADRMSDLGGLWVIIPGLVVCVLLAAWWRSGRGVALVVLAPVVAALLTDLLLKPLIGRHMHAGLSYPSGHTAVTASVALSLMLLMAAPTGPDRVRWTIRLPVTVLGVLAVLVVASGLSGAGYHYATDCVGGAALAVIVVVGLALGIDATADRIRDGGTRQPGTHTGPVSVGPSAR